MPILFCSITYIQNSEVELLCLRNSSDWPSLITNALSGEDQFLTKISKLTFSKPCDPIAPLGIFGVNKYS